MFAKIKVKGVNLIYLEVSGLLITCTAYSPIDRGSVFGDSAILANEKFSFKNWCNFCCWQGFRGRAKNCYSIAVRRVQKALQYQYISRRLKKREMRSVSALLTQLIMISIKFLLVILITMDIP